MSTVRHNSDRDELRGMDTSPRGNHPGRLVGGHGEGEIADVRGGFSSPRASRYEDITFAERIDTAGPAGPAAAPQAFSYRSPRYDAHQGKLLEGGRGHGETKAELTTGERTKQNDEGEQRDKGAAGPAEPRHDQVRLTHLSAKPSPTSPNLPAVQR